MSDDLQLLTASATRIFEDFTSLEFTNIAWNEALWSVLEEHGLTTLLSSEDPGNSDGNVRESAALLSVAGRFAANVPLNETLLASSVLRDVGMNVPAGPLTICFTTERSFQRDGDQWRLSTSCPRVPWASEATYLIVLGRHIESELVAIVPLDLCVVSKGLNLADEPRDDVVIGVTLDTNRVTRIPHGTIQSIHLKGALFRAAMMAGASERAFELTLQYSNERKQFGRSISGFQVVQHRIARMAGEVIALRTACDAAAQHISRYPSLSTATTVAVASAKTQAERTAGVVTRGAHQLHGAIGVTREHELRISTTRLWAWRDEWGNAAHWWNEIGSMVISGDLTAWETLTSL